MAPRKTDRLSSQEALIAGGVAAAAGAAAFILTRKGRSADEESETTSDAPAWTLRKASKVARPIAAKTLLINRPRSELYARWRDFASFADFMENVVRSSYSRAIPRGGQSRRPLAEQ